MTTNEADGHGKLRVAIADDHAIVRGGVREWIEREPDMVVVAEVATGDALLASLDTRPHVVILDACLGDDDGVALCERIVAAAPETAVLIFTAASTEAMLLRSLAAGARGYWHKPTDMPALVEAVRRVARGVHTIDSRVLATLAQWLGDTVKPLCARELQILELLATGSSTGQISERLGLSTGAIDDLVQVMMERFGVGSRLSLVATAIRRGLA